MKQQFGKNFKENLLTEFDKERLNESIEFIQYYLEIENLNNKTFLDAGCGSGVFTLATTELGANVRAFDLDDVAILNTKELLKEYGHPVSDEKITLGNILDPKFIESLGTYDYVMCWGVSHHTGEMWKSLDLIAQTVNIGGKIHLGIYNKADGWGFYPDGRFGPSPFWNKIKKFYSSMPNFIQLSIDKLATFGIILLHILTLNNPIKKLKENERRGMNWQSDLKDWLIGYPYEYATPEEVFEFMKERGFQLEKIRTNNGLLTNNYVFKRIK